jgi:elongation factor Tu
MPKGTERVTPGDIVAMTVEMDKPIAMHEGLAFSTRERGRTIGAGRVTTIIR